MSQPTDVSIVSFSCGSSHSLALLKTPNGTVTVSFGRGEDGQLGHGDAEERLRPQAIFSLLHSDISSVHCGAEYSIAVSHSKKQVYAWGWGDFGRLGHGDCKDFFLPASIPALSYKTVAAVACGDTHTLVATDEGELFTFGRNSNGQLGLGSMVDSLIPQKVEALAGKKVTGVAAGAEHSVICTDTGEVWAWGWGRYGNLGDGERSDRDLPTKVTALETTGITIKMVACGWRHTLGVDAEGKLWSWGWSKYGQLGHGDCNDQLVPKKVEALKDAVMVGVAGGWRHTLAADSDGRLFAWGWGKFGQLGLGDNEDQTSPIQVQTLSQEKVILLATGWKHSMALTSEGTFFSWGRGVNGQLGHSDTNDVNRPIKVKDLCNIGSMQLSVFMKEAHPVVMYDIPTGDRYAVVPDSLRGVDGEGGETMTVPEAEEEDNGGEGGGKRQKV